MSLLDRLYAGANDNFAPGNALFREAADEIERLTRELDAALAKNPAKQLMTDAEMMQAKATPAQDDHFDALDAKNPTRVSTFDGLPDYARTPEVDATLEKLVDARAYVQDNMHEDIEFPSNASPAQNNTFVAPGPYKPRHEYTEDGPRVVEGCNNCFFQCREPRACIGMGGKPHPALNTLPEGNSP